MRHAMNASINALMNGSTRRAALVIAAAIAITGCRSLGANGWGAYELTEVHRINRDAMAEQPAPVSDLALAGVRFHAIAGNQRFAYHAAVNLDAGTTLGGAGFAYDVAVLPLGGALRLGETSAIAVGTGIGALGGVRTIDDAVTLPVELAAQLGGGAVRLLARARISYIVGDSSRDRSARWSYADHADAMLGVRVGRGGAIGNYPAGNGYFVGAAYRELQGAHYIGLTIGYALDIATPPPRTTPMYYDDCPKCE